MKLVIFATKSDQTIPLWERACTTHGVALQVIDFADVSSLNGQLLYKGEALDARGAKILIRWPWNAHNLREEYNVYVQQLLDYHENILLDSECLLNFSPFYEDKLYQSFVFSELGVPTPDTWHFSDTQHARDLSYPLIAKKRVASRWRNNFVVKSYEELAEKMQDAYIGDYIFQPFLDIVDDLRIMVYRGNVLAVAGKDVVEDSPGVVRVKYRDAVEITDPQVRTDAVKICAHLGADLCGVDVLKLKDGSYTFLEANLSPQFVALEKTTGVDVADVVISDLVSGTLEV